MPKSKVVIDDISRAIVRWRNYPTKAWITGKDFYEFAIFIGHPHNPHSSKYIVDIENPEVCRAVEMINGVNGTAVLKVLQARQEEPDDSVQPSEG